MTTAQAITTKEVTLSHGKTRYLEAGTGHPLILIHGVSVVGGADDFRPAIDLLSPHYRVLAPDMLGWPPSDTYSAMDASRGAGFVAKVEAASARALAARHQPASCEVRFSCEHGELQAMLGGETVRQRVAS